MRWPARAATIAAFLGSLALALGARSALAQTALTASDSAVAATPGAPPEEEESTSPMAWRGASGATLLGVSAGVSSWLMLSYGLGESKGSPPVGLIEPLSLSLGGVALIGGAVGGYFLSSTKDRFFALALSSSAGLITGTLVATLGGLYVSGDCREGEVTCGRKATRFAFLSSGIITGAATVIGIVWALLLDAEEWRETVRAAQRSSIEVVPTADGFALRF